MAYHGSSIYSSLSPLQHPSGSHATHVLQTIVNRTSRYKFGSLDKTGFWKRKHHSDVFIHVYMCTHTHTTHTYIYSYTLWYTRALTYTHTHSHICFVSHTPPLHTNAHTVTISVVYQSINGILFYLEWSFICDFYIRNIFALALQSLTHAMQLLQLYWNSHFLLHFMAYC